MSLEEKSVLFFAAPLYDLVNAGLVWEDSPVVVDGNLISSRTPADLPQFCRAIIAALCR